MKIHLFSVVPPHELPDEPEARRAAMLQSYSNMILRLRFSALMVSLGTGVGAWLLLSDPRRNTATWFLLWFGAWHFFRAVRETFLGELMVRRRRDALEMMPAEDIG
jgi:hypothetical protein